MLGWEATSAYHTLFERSELPVARRLHRQANAMNALRGDRANPPMLEMLVDRLLAESNVDLLLYSHPTAMLQDGKFAAGVVLGTKGGEQLVTAGAYLDATDEAILWRLSRLESRERKDGSAFGCLAFNNVGRDLRLPLHLEGGISLYNGVRNREVYAEYQTSANIAACRLDMDRTLRLLKERVPQLSMAGVTRGSLEPYPLEPLVAFCGMGDGYMHPQLRNLWGCGPWMGSGYERQELHIRAETGELAASAMLETGCEARPVEPGSGELPLMENIELPLIKMPQCDILVVGGGTGGAMAALAGSGRGMRVTVLEAATFLGGLMAGGGLHEFGTGVDGGLQDVYRERICALHSLYNGDMELPLAHPEAMKLVLEQMAVERSVNVCYGATAVDVEMDGSRITGVIASTPAGRALFPAKTVIDATGDADVAALAGAPMRVGRDVDGVLHSYSLCADILLGGQKMLFTNHDSGYVDTFDVWDLTNARRAGVRDTFERWSRGFDNDNQVLSISPLLGVRQSRQIVGAYEKTLEEFVLPVAYADCVSFESARHDCHVQDFGNMDDFTVFWVWILGNRETRIGGEVPYRQILPLNVDGLLVSCRGMSCRNNASYASRMVKSIQRLGEVAAIAAELSIRQATTPRLVDIRALQAELRACGILDERWRPEPVFKHRSMDELRELFFGGGVSEAIWQLVNRGEEGAAFLHSALESGPDGCRFWAAVGLGWLRSEQALDVLLGCVESRMAAHPLYSPEIRNGVPLWQGVLALLGRIGSPRAVGVLEDVLLDADTSLDGLIAAIRALGKVCAPQRCASVLKGLLLRDKLPRERRFQCSTPISRWMATEDALWQLELAVADVLSGIGLPDSKIAARYIGDDRPYVRRYARMVAERYN
jgi:hypothetical protein